MEIEHRLVLVCDAPHRAAELFLDFTVVRIEIAHCFPHRVFFAPLPALLDVILSYRRYAKRSFFVLFRQTEPKAQCPGLRYG